MTGTWRNVFLPMIAVGALVAVAGCAPGARPLSGAPTAAVLPPVRLAPRPAQWKFTWTYKDDTFEANGDGVLRILPPERARMDFFLRNGMSGGYAILIGDSLSIPGPELVKRFLPPAPLLWASVGQLSLPPTADTIARADGDTLRVDMGTLRGGDASKAAGRAWRLAFAGPTLARVERIEDGKLEEWLTRRRGATGHWDVLYVNEAGKRRLSINVTDTTVVEGFDDAIWRRP